MPDPATQTINLSETNSKLFTDLIPVDIIPAAIRDLDFEKSNPAVALQKMLDKLHTEMNKPKSSFSIGTVVGSITTKTPQTAINKIKQATGASEQSFTEYKVVLTDEGLTLDSPDCSDPTPMDYLKYVCSKYYSVSEEVKEQINKGRQVKIFYFDDRRSDGWIGGLL
jgi:ubiquitin-protein ligase